MRDIVREQVHNYLYQFYLSKDSEILLSELKKLLIKKDDNYKLDILFIEELIKERGLSKEIDKVYKEVAENKIINKVDFKLLIKGYKAIILKENRGIVVFSFGGLALTLAIFYFVPPTWVVVNGLTILFCIVPAFYSLWILSEPILTCLILPILRAVLDYVGLIIQGLGELFNLIAGSLKTVSLFYDKEKNKPIIDRTNNLTYSDIELIERSFEKTELTKQQAQYYLNAMLSVKNNLSNNMG